MDALGCCIGASIKDGHAFAANADSALQNDTDNAHICPYVLKHAQICADAQQFALMRIGEFRRMAISGPK